MYERYKAMFKGAAWGVIILALMMMCSSCKHTEYVTVEKVKTDTLYKSKVLHDSIHVHDSISVYVKGDTVLRDRWRTKYVYHFDIDTVVDIRHDSIPLPYTVEKRISVTPQWAWYILLYAAAVTIIIVFLARRKL